ncbi:MAG: DNA polymerase III subunit delta' [Pseudomonadota bacterium]
MSDALPEADRRPNCPHPRETVEVLGQDPAVAVYLAAADSGRVHHAWMLSGPEGVGKATLAWGIARHLAAGGTETSLPSDPASPIFRRTAALAEPAIALVRRAWDPDRKRLKTRIGIDEVRALKSHFALSSVDGGWRVAIVDAADEMTPEAANGLLKLLEEPPARAVLLLICHRPAGLLPTIRSRCRRLTLNRLGPEDLAAALAAFGRAGAADPMLTILSGGSVGAAVRLLDAGGVALYERVLRLMAMMPGADRMEMLALAEAGSADADMLELALNLFDLALARLVRLGAGAEGPSGEIEVAAARRLVPDLAAAQGWSTLAASLSARARHAVAVNIDPAQILLDRLTALDAHARAPGALPFS